MRTHAWLPLAAALSLAAPAAAVPYYYVDWTSANAAAGIASGTITLPDASTVTVGFSVTQADNSAGSFSFAQTAGGFNYWASAPAPYISSQVDNAPPTSDIIALIGGSTTTTYTLTLSEAIKDPIMAILSLGQPSVTAVYDFDRPFDIVSQGTGHWGGVSAAACAATPSSCSLQELPGDILQGREGHGTIQFIGTFSTFSWTAPLSENWHGFQFGIRTTERIEPTDPTPPPTSVPEPSTLLLTLAGALIALPRMRRKPR